MRLTTLIVDDGWTYATAAKMFMVAPRTTRKWADRYRAQGQIAPDAIARTKTPAQRQSRPV
ncbi:helix-turn-helix domain-containing protein [Rhodococcus qingshengii]|nr:helix-turn-helix domain-containing protein [Rhodococcus qingshengii]